MQEQPIIASGPGTHTGASHYLHSKSQLGSRPASQGPPLACHTLLGWSETIKLPDKSRGRRRGDRIMRENVPRASFQSMAFTDCMKPTSLSTEKDMK